MQCNGGERVLIVSRWKHQKTGAIPYLQMLLSSFGVRKKQLSRSAASQKRKPKTCSRYLLSRSFTLTSCTGRMSTSGLVASCPVIFKPEGTYISSNSRILKETL